MISVVILTYNEASNLPRCLASIAWCDDILVLDSGSTDGTPGIARASGARVMQRPFDDFASQRNHALEHGELKYEWVLHLDADEEVSPELVSSMLTITRTRDAFAAYRVASRLMFMGRWLRCSGMYPCYQVRFGRTATLRFRRVGHGQQEALSTDAIGTLSGDLIHHNFSKGISDWFKRHARYAKDEAHAIVTQTKISSWTDILRTSDKTERRRVLKQISADLPWRPFLRFAYVYFLRRGFLDGSAGLRYALLMAVYQWMIDLNVRELKNIHGQLQGG